MQEIEFIAISTEAQQEELADLAKKIWNEYWPGIIGQAQTDYMVAKFQSLGAIKRDMRENGYEYWFIASRRNDGALQPIGYTGGHADADPNRYFISKIYLLSECRGHGLSSKIIDFYSDICKARNLSAMYLTVNKNNALAIRAYKRNGFQAIEAVETDIGDGFIMDDYVMEKQV